MPQLAHAVSSRSKLMGRVRGVPRVFISTVHACTNSAISSGSTVELSHRVCHFGVCCATAWLPSNSLFFDGCAPLPLNRENSGIVKYRPGEGARNSEEGTRRRRRTSKREMWCCSRRNGRENDRARGKKT